MNHSYPDNYHGYARGAPGMQGMGYGGGYGDPGAMARMGHPREGYQMAHYPMMQQSSGVYNQGGYMGQGNSPYNMAGYGAYGMQGMNQQSLMMGNRPGSDVSRMSGGNMVNPYYNSGITTDQQHQGQHGSMSNQPSTYNQAPTHIQQQHMSMMSNQGHSAMSAPAAMGQVPSQNTGPSTMTGQPMPGPVAQPVRSPAHHLPPAAPHQNSGTYRAQSPTQMIPRGHHVPQHPMRHTSTQQNPQEVADNILQMASAYPSNQTVQVPLKSRPAPYHIPRSPHYNIPHSEMPHTSPNSRQQQSPVTTCQTSPSPTSSSVKSPTPVLAPIPNPIPSPGISGLRSPCNQGMSPCGTQRSPAHLGSTYSGHSQAGPPAQSGTDPPPHHGMSPSDAQHYSPCAMTQTHAYSPYSSSPSSQRNASMYSPSSDPSIVFNQDQLRQSGYSSPSLSSPCMNKMTSYPNSAKNSSGQSTNSNTVASTAHNMGNNPLMSLQKLVMLPETQVVDPKSVVNDACLSSQHDEGPKNVDGPAERLVEGSGHSVGCQNQFSSHANQPGTNSHVIQSAGNPLAISTSETTTSSSNLSSQQSYSLPQFGQDQNYFCNANSSVDDPGLASHSSADTLNQLSSDNSHTKDPVSETLSTGPNRNFGNQSQQFENNMSVSNGSSNSENSSSRQDDGVSDKLPSVIVEEKTNPVIPSLEKSLDKSPIPLPMKPDGPEDSRVLTTECPTKVSDSKEMLSLHSPEVKNGKVKDDTKKLIVQCRSPGVLSEVPVLTNGLNGTACGNDDDLENDCGNGVHTKVRNGFNSFVKAKLVYAKRASQFAHVTPCSITVGPDERAACDRLSFRRNGLCRTLRTARVVCNVRNRNDSTGNGDSDESLENVSEGSFSVSEVPQDGNRKRPASTAKRNDYKKPSLNSVSASSQVTESESKSSGSNGCVSYNNNEVSDDDVCYYEGVDNTDIFVNNCSSDESVPSSGEVKSSLSCSTPGKETVSKNGETETSTPPSSKDKKIKSKDKSENGSDKDDIDSSPSSNKAHNLNHSSSPPPSKRLRRSSGQKAQEKLKALSVSRRSSSSSGNEKTESSSSNGVNSTIDTVVDLTAESIDQTNSARAASLGKSLSPSGSSKEQTKQGNKFKPIILGNKPAGKYPVVVLQKSNINSKQSNVIKVEKIDLIDQSASKDPQEEVGSRQATTIIKEEPYAFDDYRSEPQVKIGNEDPVFKSENNVYSNNLIKQDMPEATNPPYSATSSALSSKRIPKKKPHRRKKSKADAKVSGKVNRNTELKDSFKSMKFSRTLDLMKSQRKREQTTLGPFIRLRGRRDAPDHVAVFSQPVPDMTLLAASSKHAKNKKSHPMPAATTVHMVTNLPTDKIAMVPSTRTISQNPWVCAFCGHHSSYRFLGDLFGPYFNENDTARVESIAIEESKKSEASKDKKTNDGSMSGKKGKDSSPQERKSVRRRKSTLSPRSSEPSPPPPEEVWVHESCAMWSPGVYLVDSKLYGLDEAVKDASENVCSVCKAKGAMIGCLHKGCSMKYHFICALDRDCYMDEENLSLLCSKHKDKKLNAAGTSKS